MKQANYTYFTQSSLGSKFCIKSKIHIPTSAKARDLGRGSDVKVVTLSNSPVSDPLSPANPHCIPCYVLRAQNIKTQAHRQAEFCQVKFSSVRGRWEQEKV